MLAVVAYPAAAILGDRHLGEVEIEQSVKDFEKFRLHGRFIEIQPGAWAAFNDVIHTDPWWNPAVEDQATNRAHRIGQQRPVMVYRMIARGTIEEQILELHKDKRDLVDGILEGTEAAAKLSTAELATLIRS